MRKFYAMESRGEIPRGTTERWKKHTRNIKKLPERKSTKKANLEFNITPDNFVKVCNIVYGGLPHVIAYLRNLLSSRGNQHTSAFGPNSLVTVQTDKDNHTTKVGVKSELPKTVLPTFRSEAKIPQNVESNVLTSIRQLPLRSFKNVNLASRKD